MNLLINAMDALDDSVNDPKKIIVTPRRGDGPGEGRVELLVHDNGHGMASDVLTRAFDAFHTTRPQGGRPGFVIVLLDHEDAWR